jgi:hypothetical protein
MWRLLGFVRKEAHANIHGRPNLSRLWKYLQQHKKSPLSYRVRTGKLASMSKKPVLPPDDAPILYAMDPDLLRALVSGGIWRTAPVSQSPQIVLESWTIRQLANGDRHFVGWNCTDHEGRASSKIVTFDPTSLRGVTRSGRVYELRGRPGHDRDAEHVWASWLRINGKPAWTDVTPEARPRADDTDAVAAADFARMCAEKSYELTLTADKSNELSLDDDVPEAKDFGPFRGRRQ